MPSCSVCPSVSLSVCQSVRPSVSSVYYIERSKRVINFFSPSGSVTFLVFRVPNVVASNAGGLYKIVILDQYLALSGK